MHHIIADLDGFNNGIARYALHNTPTRRKPVAAGGRGHVGSSVATGLLKISPDFLSKNMKKTDKETTFKSLNTSKINA